jgi:LysR substrate binding domain
MEHRRASEPRGRRPCRASRASRRPAASTMHTQWRIVNPRFRGNARASCRCHRRVTTGLGSLASDAVPSRSSDCSPSSARFRSRRRARRRRGSTSTRRSRWLAWARVTSTSGSSTTRNRRCRSACSRYTRESGSPSCFPAIHSRRPAIRPGDLAGETLLSPPRTANPAFHDVLDRALSAAGHRVRRRRETRGSHPHDVLFAVAQGQGVALGPPSILRSAGELGAMLSSRLLDPPVHLPDTQLAWRADPPSALADAAQEVAAKLYAFSTQQ